MDEDKVPDSTEPDQQDPYHFLPVDPFNMNSQVEVNQDSDRQTVHDDLQQRFSSISLSANPQLSASSQSNSLNHAIPENNNITSNSNNFNGMNLMGTVRRPFPSSLSSSYLSKLLENTLQSRDEREVEHLISTVLHNASFEQSLLVHELVCVLEEVPAFKSEILRSLIGNYARLSIQKYSSNVVEKCIKMSDDSEFQIIVNELSRNIIDVLLNEFGNYVIKAAVCRAEGNIFEEICQILRKFENSACVSINKIFVQNVFKVIAQKRRLRFESRFLSGCHTIEVIVMID
ncbi:hypothetical protein J5N97_008518 [Dioscorea zingiberensis]|uniref:PUM-HD domain-containing protein n=1 Tax=Dioscorea zingiberensis TaxID=325984 RepID=A0A9D5CVW4_9LILI|nr:hypothetical protein J5N97_008518 [Dioscorea zingiberensis]